MSRAAARLRALERRRPAAQQFLIVYQDTEQPGRWLGKPREGQAAEVVYTDQHLAALPASTQVIKVCYVDWREQSGGQW